MNGLTHENLRAATGGRWIQPPPRLATLRGVGIDSRGDLTGRAFVAIRGRHFDGHDFVAGAAAAGARIVIVHRPPPRLFLQQTPASCGRCPGGIGILLVDDTTAALGRLASWHRSTLTCTVVAVTGSAGKTTVKHLIGAVASTARRGRSAPKSFNNEIGVPLSILSAEPHDHFLVVEIGANRPGEIDSLAAIARPDIAVITSVGRAHLEGFGTPQNVAREKAAILRHVAPGGAAIVTADAPLLRPHLRGDLTTVLCGEAPDADLRLSGRGTGWIEINRTFRFRLGLPGLHNARNALLAVAAGRRLGIADRLIDDALGAASPVEGRLSRHEAGGVTVWHDAYNANPESLAAGLETFGELSADAAHRVVVLGDMLELGPQAPALHREAGRRLLDLDAKAPIAHAVLIGALSAHTAEALRGAWNPCRVTQVAELSDDSAALVGSILRPGDTVLLKASRGIALERILGAVQGAHALPA